MIGGVHDVVHEEVGYEGVKHVLRTTVVWSGGLGRGHARSTVAFRVIRIFRILCNEVF